MIDDTLLRLYLNHNLDQETAARVEAELQRDPALRQRLEAMKAGEPSFANQEVQVGGADAQPAATPDARLGATEDQVQPNVEPVARNPVPDSSGADEAGIDPHTEITPG